MQSGKLGDSSFLARLKKVKFGRYTDATGELVPACLILVHVKFTPKSRGWFRFRDANFEASFTDEQSKETLVKEEDEEDDNDDEDGYDGPLVLKIYPGLIRGHTQSSSQQFNLSLNVPLTPLSAGPPALTTGFTNSRAKGGLHLVQGLLLGEPETRVKWRMHENEVVRGGVYEQPIFAVVVRYREGEPFMMALSIRATTYGGLAVIGKGGTRITFRPGKHGAKKQPAMSDLTGGTVQVEGQTWGAKQGALTEPAKADLETLDLEALTGMKAELLSAQGPGSATPST